MTKKNGNGIIYKDGKAFLDGKLIAIGVKEGEHIPRASDYKLPKRLDAKTRRLIETTEAVMEELLKTKKTSLNANENGRLPKASDFKLPKKLDALAKRRIETSRAILEEFRKVREKESKSE